MHLPKTKQIFITIKNFILDLITCNMDLINKRLIFTFTDIQWLMAETVIIRGSETVSNLGIRVITSVIIRYITNAARRSTASSEGIIGTAGVGST